MSAEIRLATARASFATGEPLQLPASQAGDQFDIQWMPAGQQDITCYVNGEPREMKFEVKAKHAGVMNGALQELLRQAAAGEGDLPFIDFNHDDGAAAGHGTEFYWAGTDPKRGGIRLRGRYTGSGKKAVANRDFLRFSPQWDFDEGTGEPIGLGVNLGGLVNKAAFRTIQSVAAKAAELGRTPEEARLAGIITRAFKPLVDRLTRIEELRDNTAAAKCAVKDVTPTRAIATGRQPSGDKRLVNHSFVHLVHATAAENQLSFVDAVAQARAKNPEVFAEYQRALAAPAETEDMGENHAFLVEARTVAARDGIGEAQAKQVVARRNWPLYQSYAASLTATARKGREAVARSSGAGEFIAQVRALEREGYSTAAAASLASAKRPDLYKAYRLTCQARLTR